MRWRNLAILAAAGVAVAGPVRADDLTNPYRVEVVLQFGAHRWLKGDFRDRIAREIRDELQTSLGKRDTVEVVELKLDDKTPAMWKRVAGEGLGVLDSFPELSDTKTHFVQIDFVDGTYEIAARQHDGTTGLASPLVRKASVPDRLLVGHIAVRLINRDFGLAGGIVKQDGDTVTVQLKAAGRRARH